MNKHLIVIGIVVLLLVVGLSGCNEISNDDDDTNQSEVEPDNKSDKSEGKDDDTYIDNYLFKPMESIMDNLILTQAALTNHRWTEVSSLADSGKKNVEQLIFEIQKLDVSDKYEPLRFNQLQWLDNLKEAFFCLEKGSAAGNNGYYAEALTYGNMVMDYIDQSNEYLDTMMELYKEIFG